MWKTFSDLQYRCNSNGLVTSVMYGDMENFVLTSVIKKKYTYENHNTQRIRTRRQKIITSIPKSYLRC